MVFTPRVRTHFITALSCLAFLVSVSLPCAAETLLLDFSSPTCGPCQQMRPVVQRLAGDGFQVREVDISRDPQTAARFSVTQVPTFLVMVDGRVVDKHIGATSYDQLRAMMLRATPAAPPRRAVTPLGQSPQIPNTFAVNSQATITPAAGSNASQPFADNLSQPQAGRIISLQDPSAAPPRTATVANPFAKAPPRQPSSPSGSAALHNRLIASSVKISIEDPEGKSAGTGTIVDARSGEALILTCGHLFRSSEGKGRITVTTFQAGPNGAVPTANYAAQLIDYDLDRDLALISMRPTSPVQALAIAGPAESTILSGATVTSVGCNHGDNPTAIASRVTANNRYQGHANIEVAGAPVEGRSGGGLFNAQGQLVGVCFAADHEGNEGLYAALPSIYAKLDSLNLKMVYQPGAVSPAPPQAQPTSVAAAPMAAIQPPVSQVRGQEPDAPSFAQAPIATPSAAALSTTEQAALEEIQRRGADSEVICIIRPKNPNAKSEVITLSNVSPGFVQELTSSPNVTSNGPSPATATAGQLLR